MANLTKKEIAGISFLTECENCIILKEPRPCYESFVKKVDKAPRDIDIKIRLELGSMPNVEALSKVFNGGQAWSMYQDGEDYFLALNPPPFKQPLWLAKIDRGFTKVIVYCGEQLVSDRNGKIVVSNPAHYPLDQILLMYVLARRQGALLHAAGIGINGKGYVFPGKSGAGKSTLARQFAARGNAGLLSDDRVVVRKFNGAFNTYGTPWPGEAGIAVNQGSPLSGIFFIYHKSENIIREIKPQETFERLLPVTSIPWYDKEIMPEILLFCESVASQIPAYELHFKPGSAVVDVFERFVSA